MSKRLSRAEICLKYGLSIDGGPDRELQAMVGLATGPTVDQVERSVNGDVDTNGCSITYSPFALEVDSVRGVVEWMNSMAPTALCTDEFFSADNGVFRYTRSTLPSLLGDARDAHMRSLYDQAFVRAMDGAVGSQYVHWIDGEVSSQDLLWPVVAGWTFYTAAEAILQTYGKSCVWCVRRNAREPGRTAWGVLISAGATAQLISCCNSCRLDLFRESPDALTFVPRPPA